MKKCFLFFALLISINLNAQSILDPTPLFAEKLFQLNESQLRNSLIKNGFVILTKDEMRSLKYKEEEIDLYIVGIDKYNIICKVLFDKSTKKIKSILLGNVIYLKSDGMLREFKEQGYILDEKNSTINEMIFVKKTKTCTFFAFIEFSDDSNGFVTIQNYRMTVK